jgi:hypothetical protein
MVEKYLPPASIECEKALLKARKLIIVLPIFHDVLKQIVYKSKMDLNSSARIQKELNPKLSILDDNSMLDKGDAIIGNLISVLTKRPIKKDKAQIKKGSSTHKASFIETKSYTYAKLEKAFPSLERKKV